MKRSADPFFFFQPLAELRPVDDPALMDSLSDESDWIAGLAAKDQAASVHFYKFGLGRDLEADGSCRQVPGVRTGSHVSETRRQESFYGCCTGQFHP